MKTILQSKKLWLSVVIISLILILVSRISLQIVSNQFVDTTWIDTYSNIMDLIMKIEGVIMIASGLLYFYFKRKDS